MENKDNTPRNTWFQKAAKAAGSILGVLLILFCLFCTIRTVRGYCRVKTSHRGESKSYERLSEQVGQMWIDGHTVRTVDWKTKKPISPKLRWINPSPWDSLAVFSDSKGRRGYLNAHTGRIVIPGQYLHAWVFSEGLAAVANADGRLGFIRHDGTYAIDPVFDYDRSLDYVFHEGLCWIREDKGYFGAIDHSGQWFLDPVFESVSPNVGRSFVVGLNGKYGLMDSTLHWTFPPEYDHITFSSERDDAVFLTRDGVKRLVTLKGEILEPFIVDYVGPLRYEETEEEDPKPASYLWFRVDDKRGVMRARDGKVILPAIYEDVDLASETMFECSSDEVYDLILLFDLEGKPLGEKIAGSIPRVK